MSQTVYTAGEYYHIYNRGVNRERIFFEDRNWEFFIHRLHRYFTPDRADIIAYCLMPNHYHLLVCLHTDDFSHAVMQPFATSYTKAINKEQDRVGALFQGRFKGRHIDKGDYLIHLTRYIHRNPVQARLVSSPSDWEHSSYKDYTHLRKDALSKPDIILTQFISIDEYASFVNEGDDNYDSIQNLLLD